MTLHDGERRVLAIFAVCLLVGGGVRCLARVESEWTPGLRVGDEVDSTVVSLTQIAGTRAEFDSLFVEGRLDLNRADAAHLTMLPGIGPALAARMVESRRREGRFTSIDDLVRVKGIGPKTVERLRSVVWVADPR